MGGSGEADEGPKPKTTLARPSMSAKSIVFRLTVRREDGGGARQDQGGAGQGHGGGVKCIQLL